ncbi:hypothetical protein DY000_02039828 [Brassica cretica]|uniref:ABC transporter domain-containing protein n=1 Tax=Brassica cretica TaxID=69181 RepID=A0ABQ7BJW0_BRACR|nr:hypothetical protein DY000_02039828 [Brassica cretica]
MVCFFTPKAQRGDLLRFVIVLLNCESEFMSSLSFTKLNKTIRASYILFRVIPVARSCPKISLGKPQIPRLLLRNVSCMRNAQQILRHVNVSSHDSGALVLTGTNGSGKSTFLRMLAGFSKPSAGEILWNGPDITKSGTFQQ